MVRNRLRTKVTHHGQHHRHHVGLEPVRHPCGCAGLPELVGDCGDVYLPPVPLICC